MEIKDQMNSIVKEGKEYLQIQSSLVQLQVKKTTAILLAKSATSLLSLVIFLLFFVFASLSTAFYLAEVYHSLFKGFAILSLFYFLLFIIFILFNQPIKKYFSNKFIALLFNNENND